MMNDLSESLVVILAVAVLIAVQTLSVLNARTYHLTEDARAVELVSSCELWDIYSPSQQPRTLVLACRGADAIRLWPLLVQQPSIDMSGRN